MDINTIRTMMAEEGFTRDQISKVERIVILAMHEGKQLPSTDIDNTEEIVKRFLGTKKLKGCKSSTLKAYRHTLNKMYAYTHNLVNASTDDIRYFMALTASTNTAITLDNHRRNLSSFYRWAYREKIINENPMECIDRIKTEKMVKLPFQSFEIERMKDAAETYEEKAILPFLLSTGVRCSELAIPLSKVNFNTREVIVMGKGAKERKVYMNDACLVHIEKYLNDRRERGMHSEWLFISSRKYGGQYRCISSKKSEQIVHDIGRKANVDNVHIHRFRRHFCCHLIRLGCSLTTIQTLMGHESISTTQHYISVSDDAVKSEFMKLCI